MAALSLPESFQESYRHRDKYPQNLILRTISTYPSALAAYKSRLDLAAPNLFESNESEFDVSFRDLGTDDGGGKGLEKRNLHTAEKLTIWLGISQQSNNDPVHPTVAAQRKDPKCRFIYIYGKTSRSRLRISRSMLEEILTFHQVMPDYLDFMAVFGLQSEARDLRFSSFREQTALKAPSPDARIPNLGRSGRQYQLCYNLKGVTLTKPSYGDPTLHEWSIRQSAFYHRFDVEGGNALWIVTKGNLDIQERFKELTGKNARPEDKSFGTVEECFRSSLSAHLVFCQWATEDWRGYIKWLESCIEDETVMAVLGPRGPNHKIYKADDIQELQGWEEKVSEVMAVLEANVEVMSLLRDFYERTRKNPDFGLEASCGDDIDIFTAQISGMVHDLRMQILRAKVVSKVTTDRKELILQHLQGQSAGRLEELNRSMAEEAIVVRIITVVTLFYLPATFVSTVFGTDIVKYQGTQNGSFHQVAMARWAEVTLPLTLLTMVAAWIGKRWAEDRRGLRKYQNTVKAEPVPITTTSPKQTVSSATQGIMLGGMQPKPQVQRGSRWPKLSRGSKLEILPLRQQPRQVAQVPGFTTTGGA